MINRKILAYGLIAAMTMSTAPTQIFAQSVNNDTPIIAEQEPPLTTDSAIQLAVAASRKKETYTEREESLITVTKDGEITQSFDISYKWDDSWFFQDNTVFNQDLARTSSIFAALSYYSSKIDLQVNEADASTYAYAFDSEDGEINNISGISKVFKSHDLKDVKEYNLRNYADDNHVAQFNIAHKKIGKGKDKKELVVISIRGTRGEMEWLSNFAMGQDAEFDYISEWTEKQNHMGFDIAANRIVELVEEYIDRYKVKGDDVTFWITGHSRGGALANLVGKKLEDQNFDTYTYSFATPNTTLEADAADKYPSIFNIVNEDDLVPAVPSEAWGFTKYGQTLNVDMTEDLKLVWQDIVGKKYTTESASGLATTLNALGDIISDRNDAHVYGEDLSQYTVTKSFTSEEKRAQALASIPEACMPYAEIELYESVNALGKTTYNYKMLQKPMYFITAAGLNLAGTMGPLEFVAFDVAGAYKTAKSRLMASGIAGLSHPHYMESYIVLADRDQF